MTDLAIIFGEVMLGRGMLSPNAEVNKAIVFSLNQIGPFLDKGREIICLP